jgi:hypothetical protein
VAEAITQGKHDALPPFATWAVAAVAVTAGIVAALSGTRYGTVTLVSVGDLERSVG